MYPKYNIPQNQRNMQLSNQNMAYNGDRFVGGGFIAPFLLGGIAGSLVTRPNNGYGYYNQPPMVYYPPMPYPYYTSNNYYY